MSATSVMNTTPAAQSWPRLREIVLPVRIDDDRVRQKLGRLMMVEHDRIEAEPARLGERLVAHGAAIDRDQKLGAGGGEARIASTLGP